MMPLLIPSPQAPGKDIDVYLRPLVDELKELWSDGVETFDASIGECFKMHASVLWTINDFPAYANLYGWSTKGYMACPTFNKDAPSQKRYVRNNARLEGSIAEGCIIDECLTFCSMYLTNIETRFNREDRNADGSSNKEEHVLDIFSESVRPFNGDYDAIPKKDFDMAQWYVLNSCEEAEHFVQEHKNELLNQDVVNIEEKHRGHFFFMIMHLYNKENSMFIKKLYPLAMGPNVRGRRYPCCIVNGVCFFLILDHKYDMLEMQNSKVESDELHTTDDVYQDVSIERDGVHSITLDSSALELKIQTGHEVGYNIKDSDLEDDTMIEYISDLDKNEGTKSTNNNEDGDRDDEDDIDFVI
ncbi:hypothetical protein KY290_012214 [Solanum tuberosum]|uniref:DUF4218 domain-containing protein n=1 Tax=Solanum tuberosum TaxID=4113 RepID=A0ABQ7W2Z1_SOLTU|nr:hypothetical protein KY290_012214 [Solanum tuberosum]